MGVYAIYNTKAGTVSATGHAIYNMNNTASLISPDPRKLKIWGRGRCSLKYCEATLLFLTLTAQYTTF